MTELREFARHKSDFDKLNTKVVLISSDDVQHAKEAWADAGEKQFTVLSDPQLTAIREYGLVHAHGHGEDIAIRTLVLIGPDGRELWRWPSKSVFDVPKVGDVLARIRTSVGSSKSAGARLPNAVSASPLEVAAL